MMMLYLLQVLTGYSVLMDLRNRATHFVINSYFFVHFNQAPV